MANEKNDQRRLRAETQNLLQAADKKADVMDRAEATIRIKELCDANPKNLKDLLEQMQAKPNTKKEILSDMRGYFYSQVTIIMTSLCKSEILSSVGKVNFDNLRLLAKLEDGFSAAIFNELKKPENKDRVVPVLIEFIRHGVIDVSRDETALAELADHFKPIDSDTVQTDSSRAPAAVVNMLLRFDELMKESKPEFVNDKVVDIKRLAKDPDARAALLACLMNTNYVTDKSVKDYAGKLGRIISSDDSTATNKSEEATVSDDSTAAFKTEGTDLSDDSAAAIKTEETELSDDNTTTFQFDQSELSVLRSHIGNNLAIYPLAVTERVDEAYAAAPASVTLGGVTAAQEKIDNLLDTVQVQAQKTTWAQRAVKFWAPSLAGFGLKISEDSSQLGGGGLNDGGISRFAAVTGNSYDMKGISQVPTRQTLLTMGSQMDLWRVSSDMKVTAVNWTRALNPFVLLDFTLHAAELGVHRISHALLGDKHPIGRAALQLPFAIILRVPALILNVLGRLTSVPGVRESTVVSESESAEKKSATISKGNNLSEEDTKMVTQDLMAEQSAKKAKVRFAGSEEEEASLLEDSESLASSGSEEGSLSPRSPRSPRGVEPEMKGSLRDGALVGDKLTPRSAAASSSAGAAVTSGQSATTGVTTGAEKGSASPSLLGRVWAGITQYIPGTAAYGRREWPAGLNSVVFRAKEFTLGQRGQEYKNALYNFIDQNHGDLTGLQRGGKLAGEFSLSGGANSARIIIDGDRIEARGFSEKMFIDLKKNVIGATLPEKLIIEPHIASKGFHDKVIVALGVDRKKAPYSFFASILQTAKYYTSVVQSFLTGKTTTAPVQGATNPAVVSTESSVSIEKNRKTSTMTVDETTLRDRTQNIVAPVTPIKTAGEVFQSVSIPTSQTVADETKVDVQKPQAIVAPVTPIKTAAEVIQSASIPTPQTVADEAKVDVQKPQATVAPVTPIKTAGEVNPSVSIPTPQAVAVETKDDVQKHTQQEALPERKVVSASPELPKRVAGLKDSVTVTATMKLQLPEVNNTAGHAKALSDIVVALTNAVSTYNQSNSASALQLPNKAADRSQATTYDLGRGLTVNVKSTEVEVKAVNPDASKRALIADFMREIPNKTDVKVSSPSEQRQEAMVTALEKVGVPVVAPKGSESEQKLSAQSSFRNSMPR